MTNAAANVDNERPNVFIHTNHRQMLGAIVSRYSMKRNSAEPDAFDVHLIDHAGPAGCDRRTGIARNDGFHSRANERRLRAHLTEGHADGHLVFHEEHTGVVVTGDMVEAIEFPHLSNKYNVMGVPRTVINEHAYLEGAAPEAMLMAKVREAIAA